MPSLSTVAASWSMNCAHDSQLTLPVSLRYAARPSASVAYQS